MPRIRLRALRPPFPGSPRGAEATQGSASLHLGYIPAAAARLKAFAMFSDETVVHNVVVAVPGLRAAFEERSDGALQLLVAHVAGMI